MMKKGNSSVSLLLNANSIYEIFIMPSCRAGRYFLPQKVSKKSSLKNFARWQSIPTNAKFCYATFCEKQQIEF